MDPQLKAILLDLRIQAALIAAFVSIIGHFITYWKTQAELNSKITELTQAQLKDIIAKRIEVYPQLWRIAQTELSDLKRQETIDNPDWVPNAGWARNLLDRLLAWHKDYGAFLSQDSYDAFAKLRNELRQLILDTRGASPSIQQFDQIDLIYYRDYTDRYGRVRLPLATCLKNDLGSYVMPAIVARHGQLPPRRH